MRPGGFTALSILRTAARVRALTGIKAWTGKGLKMASESMVQLPLSLGLDQPTTCLNHLLGRVAPLKQGSVTEVQLIVRMQVPISTESRHSDVHQFS